MNFLLIDDVKEMMTYLSYTGRCKYLGIVALDNLKLEMFKVAMKHGVAMISSTILCLSKDGSLLLLFIAIFWAVVLGAHVSC